MEAPWWSSALRDMRIAIRGLARRRGYSFTAIALLALGIGSTTAAFSVFSAVVLRPLPFPAPQDLVAVWSTLGAVNRASPSYPDFLDWRASATGFQGLVFARGRIGTIQRESGAESLLLALVSDGYFSVLGARPAAGRLLMAGDERPDAGRVIVLSFDTWQRRFGGSPSIVGTSAALADGPAVIVGVLPQGWAYPSWAEAFTPLATTNGLQETLAKRDLRGDNMVIGRVASGTAPPDLQRDLDRIAGQLQATYPEDAGFGIRAERLVDLESGDVRPHLVLLVLAAGCLLLLIASNVANLGLVASLGRTQEFAVRTALGARRGQIARQIIIENLTLAIVAGVFGFLVARLIGSLLVRLAPIGLTGLDGVVMNWRVFVFCGGVSIVCGLACGLLPAISAGRTGVIEAIKEGGPTTSGGRGKGRTRATLVGIEIGVAVVLLIGLALLVQSFIRLRAIDPGFKPDQLVALRLVPPAARYEDSGRRLALYDQVQEAVGSIPGVRATAIVNNLPMTGSGAGTPLSIEGRTVDSLAETGFRTISPAYFATMGVPLLRGRMFTVADMDSTASVAIISRALADRYFPDRDPVGRRIVVERRAQNRPDYGQPLGLTVVGVVGDVKQYTLTEDREATVYAPYPVNPWPGIYLISRVTGPPTAISERIRAAIAKVDATVPVVERLIVGDLPRLRLDQQRFTTTVLAVFAIAAFAVALVGIYGMVAYAAAQRARELAIRIAIGASPRDVFREVAVLSLWPTIIGTATGMLAAFALAQVGRSLLYGVTLYDPLTFIAVPVGVVVAALAASSIPAFKARNLPPRTLLTGS